MFDTHCHLNFSIFEGKVEMVINQAKKAGVDYFIVPGTDLDSSKKAVEIAQKFNQVYAAVGIHPHHIYQYQTQTSEYQKFSPEIKKDLREIKKLLFDKKTVAVGEVGLDQYIYRKTKYRDYKINQQFIDLQKRFFIKQLELGKQFKKAVIIHNRQAKADLLKILTDCWDNYFSGRMIFHCCEPDFDLLTFAKERKIFIGVDGDVTYDKRKQEFVEEIPLDLLLLETDSPFLLPKLPKKGVSKKYNQPKNLPLIAKFVAKVLSIPTDRLIDITTKNAKRLLGED